MWLEGSETPRSHANILPRRQSLANHLRKRMEYSWARGSRGERGNQGLGGTSILWQYTARGPVSVTGLVELWLIACCFSRPTRGMIAARGRRPGIIQA